MEAAEFTPRAPGQLLAIDGGHAFLPQLLPDGLPTDLLSAPVFLAFDEARGALGEFLGRASRVPNELLLTTPLLTIEAVQSNRIEGTYTQVAEVLQQHVAGRPKDEELANRNLEVLLYRDALRFGEHWISDSRPVTQGMLRGLHAELLREGRGALAGPGVYRDKQVLIGGATPKTASFVPPPPEHIGPLMDNFERYLREPRPYPSLITCAVAHYQFEAIHPFTDGNGRMGRLLMPLLLLAEQTIDRPIIYVSAYLEAHRAEYLERLKRVSTHGEWIEWVLFFLAAIRSQAVDSADRVERILALRDRFYARVRDDTRSQAAILAIDLIMEQVYVTVPQVAAYARCRYNTAKAAIDALVDLKVLRNVQGLYPATWVCDDLLEEVYA